MRACILTGKRILAVMLCCSILLGGCGTQAYPEKEAEQVIRMEVLDDGFGGADFQTEEWTEPFEISGRPEPSEAEVLSESFEKSGQPEPSEAEVLSEPPERYSADWSEERLLEEIGKRSIYREQCAYYGEWMDYMENVREVRDIAMYVEPLYATDVNVYSKEDFEGVPPLILHLARNEIYARHGYIFRDTDLYSFFMIQVWYLPCVAPEEFDDSVFSETERHNLELLKEIEGKQNEENT